jgi:hypothetical protein
MLTRRNLVFTGLILLTPTDIRFAQAEPPAQEDPVATRAIVYASGVAVD